MALEKLKNCFKDEDVRANYATAGLNDNSVTRESGSQFRIHESEVYVTGIGIGTPKIFTSPLSLSAQPAPHSYTTIIVSHSRKIAFDYRPEQNKIVDLLA
jgi:hypothetical protein